MPFTCKEAFSVQVHFVWEPVNSLLRSCHSSERLRSECAYNLSLDVVVCASTLILSMFVKKLAIPSCKSHISSERKWLFALVTGFLQQLFFSKSRNITVTPTESLEETYFKITFLSFPVQGALYNFQLCLVKLLLLTSSFHSWSTLHSLPGVLRNLWRLSYDKEE